MKKFLLSAFVVGVFVFYSLLQRQQQANPLSINTLPVSPTPSPASIPVTDSPTTQTGAGGPPTDTATPVQPGQYKDGQYTSSPVDYFYGTLQLKAIVSQGKLTDIQFLQYAQDRMQSMMISQMALPQLKQEAITAQNANVDMVSGATDTSQAFIQALGEVLSQAKS